MRKPPEDRPWLAISLARAAGRGAFGWSPGETSGL